MRAASALKSISISVGSNVGAAALGTLMGNIAGQAGLPDNADDHGQTLSVISPATVTLTGNDSNSRKTADQLTARDASTANGSLVNTLTLQQAGEIKAGMQKAQENAQAASIVAGMARDSFDDFRKDKLKEVDTALKGLHPDDPLVRVLQEERKQYTMGGTYDRTGKAVASVLQGLMSGDLKSGLIDAAAPELAHRVKEATQGDDTANILAHAVLGGILASAKGQNAMMGALGEGAAPLLGKTIASQLYPGQDPASYTEDQKKSIANLTSLAGSVLGGVAGKNASDAETAGHFARNEVENNFLSQVNNSRRNQALKVLRDNTGILRFFTGKGNVNEAAQTVVQTSALDARSDDLLRRYHTGVKLSIAEKNELEVYLGEYAQSNGMDAVKTLLRIGPSPNVDNRDDNELKLYAKNLVMVNKVHQGQAAIGTQALFVMPGVGTAMNGLLLAKGVVQTGKGAYQVTQKDAQGWWNIGEGLLDTVSGGAGIWMRGGAKGAPDVKINATSFEKNHIVWLVMAQIC